MSNLQIRGLSQYSGGFVSTGNSAIDYNTIVPAAYTNTIHVDDDTTLEFSNGYKIKGSEFSVCIKLLHKLAREEYPEEFL